MRVLITGGAGFIGSHLVDRFLKDGFEVRVVDNLEARIHAGRQPNFPEGVEFLERDVRERRTWEEALDDVQVVSHQAAYQDYMLDFSKFIATNVLSTALLYEVLVERRSDVKKIIVASSQAVYGEGKYHCAEHGDFFPFIRSGKQMGEGRWEVECPNCCQPASPLLLHEDFPHPVNQYAVSKLSGEQLALGLARLHRIPTVSLRYSITQGPRQSLFNQYSGVMRIFTVRALSGHPILIYEDGFQTRDFVHVQDVVEANMTVLASPNADYEAFNVGGGRRVTIAEFAQKVLEGTGSKSETRLTGQYRIGDNRHSVSSIEKLKVLGWAPRHAVDRNLKDFLLWVEEFGGVPDLLPDAHTAMSNAGVVKG